MQALPVCSAGSGGRLMGQRRHPADVDANIVTAVAEGKDPLGLQPLHRYIASYALYWITDAHTLPATAPHARACAVQRLLCTGRSHAQQS